MKIIQKIKEARKRKIERSFYKYFPERESWVEPEKQLATMTVSRVKPEIVRARVIGYCSDYIRGGLDHQLKEYAERDIAKKLAIGMIEKGLISYRIDHDPINKQIAFYGEAEVLPPRNREW